MARTDGQTLQRICSAVSRRRSRTVSQLAISIHWLVLPLVHSDSRADVGSLRSDAGRSEFRRVSAQVAGLSSVLRAEKLVLSRHHDGHGESVARVWPRPVV